MTLLFVICMPSEIKPGDVKSFCCDAYELEILPAAHSQHQQNMR